MNQLKILSWVLIMLGSTFVMSCVHESITELEETPYFDLEGFIEEQTKQLDGKEVRKISHVQEDEKKTSLTYSTEDWKEELSVFAEADINKPSLTQSYSVDTTGNMVTYTLLPKADAKVKFIEITYSGTGLRRISLELSDENLFYSSNTQAELSINDDTSDIESYTIETSQKIWFLDENNMKIQGIIAH